MSTDDVGAEKASATTLDAEHPEKYVTRIQFWPVDEDGWRATEPGGESDLVGEGEYPEAAVADYCAAVSVAQNRPEADE